MRYITIKDADGILRPKAYLETEKRFFPDDAPKIEEGERLVWVEINELEDYKN